jgi:hypothetical protein
MLYGVPLTTRAETLVRLFRRPHTDACHFDDSWRPLRRSSGTFSAARTATVIVAVAVRCLALSATSRRVMVRTSPASLPPRQQDLITGSAR